MTERKPPGVSWQHWTDHQIRDAEARGLFDDLPGKGKPISDLDRPHDELWWVKKKLKEEKVSFLPPALAIRREVEITRAAVAAATEEDAVRRLLGNLNDRIREVNRTTISGPPTTVMPLDVEEEVQKWRALPAATSGDVQPR